MKSVHSTGKLRNSSPCASQTKPFKVSFLPTTQHHASVLSHPPRDLGFALCLPRLYIDQVNQFAPKRMQQLQPPAVVTLVSFCSGGLTADPVHKHVCQTWSLVRIRGIDSSRKKYMSENKDVINMEKVVKVINHMEQREIRVHQQKSRSGTSCSSVSRCRTW